MWHKRKIFMTEICCSGFVSMRSENFFVQSWIETICTWQRNILICRCVNHVVLLHWLCPKYFVGFFLLTTRISSCDPCGRYFRITGYCQKIQESFTSYPEIYAGSLIAQTDYTPTKIRTWNRCNFYSWKKKKIKRHI